MSALYLVVVRTDDGCEVQSVHDSREQARLARHSAHMIVVALDRDACADLASEHGVVIDEDGNYAGGGSVEACDVLPDVWSREVSS